MTEEMLLLPGQAGPADVLAVGVVETHEGQDGVGQPQCCHTPQSNLCQSELSVEGGRLYI